MGYGTQDNRTYFIILSYFRFPSAKEQNGSLQHVQRLPEPRGRLLVLLVQVLPGSPQTWRGQPDAQGLPVPLVSTELHAEWEA